MGRWFYETVIHEVPDGFCCTSGSLGNSLEEIREFPWGQHLWKEKEADNGQKEKLGSDSVSPKASATCSGGSSAVSRVGAGGPGPSKAMPAVIGYSRPLQALSSQGQFPEKADS